MAFTGLLLILFVEYSFGQVHLLNTNPFTRVKCYSCNTLYAKFPGCLSVTSHYCGALEACNIIYKAGTNHVTSISCSALCPRTTQDSPDCPHGGISDHGNCHECCDDDACTRTVTSSLQSGTSVVTQPASSTSSGSNVLCPGHCSSHDLNTCVATAKTCPSGQYCKVMVSRDSSMMGLCASASTIASCRDSLHHTSSGHSRTLACCKDNNCIGNYFPISQPTTSVTTTPSTTTATAAATTSATFYTSTSAMLTNTSWIATANKSHSAAQWDEVKDACRSQTEDRTCHLMKNSFQLSCTDTVSTRLCPITCGICSVIDSIDCRDLALNHECDTLAGGTDLCKEQLALYTCPKTCGLCWLVVDDVLDAQYGNGTGNTPTQLPATSTVSAG